MACQHLLVDKRKDNFCPECGERLTNQKVCPNCGERAEDNDDRFCRRCGRKFEDKEDTE